jgi:hypothetical protein
LKILLLLNYLSYNPIESIHFQYLKLNDILQLYINNYTHVAIIIIIDFRDANLCPTINLSLVLPLPLEVRKAVVVAKY